MEKIRFITDSASDMRACPEKNVAVLPLTIHFGDDSYLDGVTINHREFFEKLIESDVLPTTSLVSPSDFEDQYKDAIEKGEKVIVVTVSSKLSGTYQSAMVAAADYSEDVFVIDSLNATIGQQILVLLGTELAEKGMSAFEIVTALEKAKQQIHIIGVLDTLEYLKKGGRISKSVAFVGGALSIKPVITVKDGEVAMLGKARGSKNGNNYMIKEVEKAEGIDFSRPYMLGYTGLDDSMLQKYIRDSESLWIDQTDSLPICSVGAAIGTHVGPNAIVVAFFDKHLTI